MKQDMIIYHGSRQIVRKPIFGFGKPYNDYGPGFYCTENRELAKEWACPVRQDGYANQYILDIEGLKVTYLTRGSFNLLNWLAILLKNRAFDIDSNIGNHAREYLLTHFLPDTSGTDVMIGYRADDSYFSFAEDFVNNMISLRDLCAAMRLGSLGEQVVLLSKEAYGRIHFLGYETADYRKYYYQRSGRDEKARSDYQRRKKKLSELKDDLFVLDIIREEMTQDDARLQFHLSE